MIIDNKSTFFLAYVNFNYTLKMWCDFNTCYVVLYTPNIHNNNNIIINNILIIIKNNIIIIHSLIIETKIIFSSQSQYFKLNVLWGNRFRDHILPLLEGPYSWL